MWYFCIRRMLEQAVKLARLRCISVNDSNIKLLNVPIPGLVLLIAEQEAKLQRGDEESEENQEMIDFLKYLELN